MARNRAEQALLESERQFRAIVEDQTELICRFDPDFRMTFSNRAHARLFGVEPEALKGLDFFVSIPEDIGKELRRNLLALTPDNPTFSIEHEKVLPSGEKTLVRLDQPGAVRRRRATERLPVRRTRHQRGPMGAGSA